MLAVATQPQSSDATTAVTALEAVALSKTIDERVVLERVDLSVAAGEFVAVLGSNGAGKSTLLRILASLVPPSGGEVRLFGEKASSQNYRLRARLGVIAHQPMVYRDLSARENLAFFARLYGVKDPGKRAMRMLDLVGLADRADDAVKTFSRGMGQRLAVARALVHDPDLLLADEPFDGLDAPSVESLEALLGDLHDAGKTIIMVNHDIEQTLRVAHRAVVLRRGRVSIDRPASQLSAADVRAEVG